jgi:malate dehydrogenase (oxaloacetate-decarboxylating)
MPPVICRYLESSPSFRQPTPIINMVMDVCAGVWLVARLQCDDANLQIPMTSERPVEGYDPSGVIETDRVGHRLLTEPLLNAGSAFTQEQRDQFGLHGLLPATVSTLEQQLSRTYEAYQRKNDDLERHIYLRSLQDRNEVLFYALLQRHLTEMMPIIYTPVVGLASEQFSNIYRRPRGLFITYSDRDRIEEIVDRAPVPRVDVIVVTDGGRILGLGDQGAGGMVIPIGKLSLYTACGGIHPGRTLPVLLDVGTDNPTRLNDPLYLGWRHTRVKGEAYDELVDKFVGAVIKRFPDVLLQWEDFGQENAGRLLQRYRHKLCTFNDDIQGTAASVIGTLLAATRLCETQLRDQRIAVLGAGAAGCGFSEQLITAMVQQGLTEAEARSRFFLIDRQGLLLDDMRELLPFQQRLAQPRASIAGWKLANPGAVTLSDVAANARVTILIGLSGRPGLFTVDIVREIARHTPRPIILPLSNPTSHSEAAPADLLEWTDGRAIIATGSSFPDVRFRGETFAIAQCNNSYVFPAIGLGVLAARARRVTDGMIMAAAQSLAETSPAQRDPKAPLLPLLRDIHDVTRHIARAVALQAQRDGVAERISPEALEIQMTSNFWIPAYPTLRRKPTES